MDGKQKITNLLDRQFTKFGGGYAAANNNAQPRRTVQRLDASTTRNKAVSPVSPRSDKTGGPPKRSNQGNGKGRQRGREKLPGLRKGNRKLPVGKQGARRKGPRTSSGRFVKTGSGNMIGFANPLTKFKTYMGKKNASRQQTHMTGGEWICTLDPGAAARTTNGGELYKIVLNPLTFVQTRLGTEAKLWQKFRFNSLTIHLVTAQISTATGSLGINVVEDPNLTYERPGEDNKRRFYITPFSDSSRMWENMAVSYKHQTGQMYNILEDGGRQLWSAGSINLFQLIASNATGAYGDIFVEYDVTFQDAIVQDQQPVANFQTLLFGSSSIIPVTSPWFILPANFTVTPQEDTIYQVIIQTTLTENGNTIVLGTPNDNYNLVPGVILYMKRAAGATKAWFFYDAMPDSNLGTIGGGAGTQPLYLPAGYGGNVLAGTIALFAVGTLKA